MQLRPVGDALIRLDCMLSRPTMPGGLQPSLEKEKQLFLSLPAIGIHREEKYVCVRRRLYQEVFVPKTSIIDEPGFTITALLCPPKRTAASLAVSVWQSALFT
jgi:hypothetical protein